MRRAASPIYRGSRPNGRPRGRPRGRRIYGHSARRRGPSDRTAASGHGAAWPSPDAAVSAVGRVSPRSATRTAARSDGPPRAPRPTPWPTAGTATRTAVGSDGPWSAATIGRSPMARGREQSAPSDSAAVPVAVPAVGNGDGRRIGRPTQAAHIRRPAMDQNGRIVAVGSKGGRRRRPHGRLRGRPRDPTAEMRPRGGIGRSDGRKNIYPPAVAKLLPRRNSGALGTPRPGRGTSGLDVRSSGAGSDV